MARENKFQKEDKSKRFKNGPRYRRDSRDEGKGRKHASKYPRTQNKGNDRRPKHEQKSKVDEVYLNRQLKDYWINLKDVDKIDEGTLTCDEEKHQITIKKFNDEMDDYWKKQKKDEPAPATS